MVVPADVDHLHLVGTVVLLGALQLKMTNASAQFSLIIIAGYLLPVGSDALVAHEASYEGGGDDHDDNERLQPVVMGQGFLVQPDHALVLLQPATRTVQGLHLIDPLAV